MGGFYVFFLEIKLYLVRKKNKSTRNKGQYLSDDPRMDYPKNAGSYLDIHEMGRVPNLVGGFDLCDNMCIYKYILYIIHCLEPQYSEI